MSEVIIDKRDTALWITINREARRNALNLEVIKGISEGFTRAECDDDIRVIVLTGAGEKAFCAGGDLNPNAAFVFDYSEPTSPYANLLRQAKASSKPSLSVINGACIAGGIGLAAMTDLAIAVDTATFSLPEVALGIFPMQVFSLLQPLVHPRVLREWCLMGETFSAETALNAGFINAMTTRDALFNMAEKYIIRLSTVSPAALRRGKYTLNAIENMSFHEAIAFTEGQLALMALSKDAIEGLASFADKRKPNFTGK
jgi:enoyl-CoA hydratase/carnithine racemase